MTGENPRDQLSPADKYALGLGRLIGNLLSLEYMLRIYLVDEELGGDFERKFPQYGRLHELQVGEKMPRNAFTEWDDLSDLIQEYNRRVRNVSLQELVIDCSVVNLRHALVHGRVSSHTFEGPPSLLKFTKPTKEDDHVFVECNYSLTSDWISEQTKKVFGEMMKVAHAKPHIFEKMPGSV